jgi:RNase P/RNase MRP subunit p29
VRSSSSRLSISLIAAIFLFSLFATAPAAADMDGVMMHGGKMMMMKAGHPATAMDHEVTMSDGTKVEVDGTVIPKDGKEFRLQNGETILMDGHLMMKGGKPAPMSMNP